MVWARLRALLAPSQRSSHASQAAAGVTERNRRRAEPTPKPKPSPNPDPTPKPKSQPSLTPNPTLTLGARASSTANTLLGGTLRLTLTLALALTLTLPLTLTLTLTRYAKMGVLLGYPDRGNGMVHGSELPGDLAVAQVRTLCAGLHADAKMPDLPSRR